jgi:DNA gyrase/topoisomerase IV subunit B
MTISEFEDLCTKYVPSIQRRFKGLGELNGSQLSKTALDINNRVSIRYTIEDVEREIAMFELMHGNSANNIADRKALMKRYKIRKDDIDN